MSLKGAVASNVEEEAKKEEEEEKEEPTNDVDDPNEEEEPTNDADEEEECKEVERVVEEDGVPPTRAPLRLKDLDKFWVPMQLEMKKDSKCDKEWVVCCGYDAMLLRGWELDDALRSEWTKATRPGWRMLIMPPQLLGEDDISLVAVKNKLIVKRHMRRRRPGGCNTRPMPRCRTSVFINIWSSHFFMIVFIHSYCAC